MFDGYSYNNLKEDLGKRLVPRSADDFHIHELDDETLGLAYVSLLRRSVEFFFGSSWFDCRQKCVILLDRTWEQLYTGHWKDISIAWRQAYSIVSYLKALSEFALGKQNACLDFREAIKTCDMGLLMGAPVLDNVLPRLASRLQQLHVLNLPSVASCDKEEISEPPAKVAKLDARLPSEPSPDRQVSMCVEPSIEHFRSAFMESETPVIIRGCMDFWPAMSHRRWGIPYLRRIAGWRLVPVELGSKYTEDSWSQKLMTINDFIDGYFENRHSLSDDDVGYLAQHQLFDQIVELKSDIVVPSYCGLGECDDVDVNAWFGPLGTVSPLHQDVKHNFLAQVVGEKYIRLYSTECTSRLYPHGSHLLNNTSQVDVERPDLEKFPLFADLPFLECVLSPGEMLYIPPMCWHYVRSLSTSFSVSFWWK